MSFGGIAAHTEGDRDRFFWRTDGRLAGHFGGLGRGLIVGRALCVGVALLVVGRVAAAAALGGVGAGAAALEGSDAGAGGGAGAGQTGHAGGGHWEEGEPGKCPGQSSHKIRSIYTYITEKLTYTSKGHCRPDLNGKCK